jgi:hypothetical protein
MPPKKDTDEYIIWKDSDKYKIWKESIDAAAAKRRNVPLSSDHFEKISKSNIGRIKSKEECENISNGLKNKPKSDIHKQHISESLKGNAPWNIGISPSKETRDKISKSKTGQKQPEETIKKRSESMVENTNTLGFKHSEETGNKMRDSAHKGSDHFNWKGGITPIVKKIRRLPEYDVWVDSIFERDNFTCRKCNHRGGDINAHHIKEFSKIIKSNNIKTVEESLLCKELWDLNNGITLCLKCHKEEHFGDSD